MDRPLPRRRIAVRGEQTQGRRVVKSADALFGSDSRFDLAIAQPPQQLHFKVVIAFAQGALPSPIEFGIGYLQTG